MLSFAMLSTAAVAPALAADLGRPAPAYKAPPSPPPPLFSWTGCYIGVSGGWLDDHKRFDRNADTVLTTVGNLVLPQTITSTSTKNSSGLVGGTVGCNYQ